MTNHLNYQPKLQSPLIKHILIKLSFQKSQVTNFPDEFVYLTGEGGLDNNPRLVESLRRQEGLRLVC